MHPESLLNQDIEALTRRLTEAEDTLYAIRAGEVDAVVVEGPAGQQIYTLESPDQPFRIFVEQMQEGAVTLNSDGIVIYCNRFFADLVGEPLEQVRGQSIYGWIADDEEMRFRELLASAASDVMHGECWFRGPKGVKVPVQLALNTLPAQDVRMFGMVVTDLSERERTKRLEAERLAAQEASIARDRFLAVVSHEIRTPLNAILGWAQILRHQSDLPPRVKQGLEVMERSAWSQAQLIDDLLDMSRVLAGKLRLDLGTIDLVEVVQGSVTALAPDASAKGIQLHWEQPEQELLLRGDLDRLQQVVGNLLSNAIKFTPANGAIHVRLRQMDEEAQLEVRDNGIGIQPERLPSMFEFYEQEEGNTRLPNTGLGLGLAIVKELTELHGGRVEAESQGPNRGATFRVCLPLLDRSAMREELVASCSNQPQLAGTRILLVEDEYASRDVLAELLRHAEAVVFDVKSGDEALRLLEEQDVDVLVSDIGLPGMDGYELIRRIRAGGRAGRDLPAVALTAFASREDRRKALVTGFQVHLPKPVDHSELCAVIANLTGLLRK